MNTKLSEDELGFMTHISMFGSDGYPIRKGSGGRWWFDKFRSAGGTPVPYKTKREAVAACELFLDILRDRKAGRL